MSGGRSGSDERGAKRPQPSQFLQGVVVLFAGQGISTTQRKILAEKIMDRGGRVATELTWEVTHILTGDTHEITGEWIKVLAFCVVCGATAFVFADVALRCRKTFPCTMRRIRRRARDCRSRARCTTCAG